MSQTLNLPFEAGLGKKSEALLLTLRRELVDGRMVPGERLPSETDLCRRFNASRGTVRRATSRLAAEGHIIVRHGSGAFVCDQPTSRSRSRTISVMFPFDRDSLRRVEEKVIGMGHLLCVFTHGKHWLPETEKAFLERVRAERHHALLAFCTPLEPRNEELLQQLEYDGVRVIHVEHYRMTPPDQNYVLPDYRRGGYVAASALMIAGYADLRFIGMRGDSSYSKLIEAGFNDAVRDQRGASDAEQAFFQMPCVGPSDPESYQIVDRFVDGLPRPTGLLCRSREIANILVESAKRVGKQVPQEVGIVGVDQLIGSGEAPLTDEISFDWVGALERALEEVDRPTWRRVQEWFAPTLVRRGTVRGQTIMEATRS